MRPGRFPVRGRRDRFRSSPHVTPLEFRPPCALRSILAALAACSSSEPDPVAALYDLRTLNQSALPYDHEGLGCCVYLGGTLELRTGRYTASLTARTRNTGLVFTATEWGKYTRQLQEIAFALDSFAVAPLGFDVGTLEEIGIEVAFGGEGHGSPDQFYGFFVLRD